MIVNMVSSTLCKGFHLVYYY